MLSSKGDFFFDMQVDVQNTTVLSADGSSIKLGEYSGEVILVVNVASYCGNTAQYEDLQKLHDLYSSKGLRILAFPCNDFGKQEPSDNLNTKKDIQCYLQRVNFFRHASRRTKYHCSFFRRVICKTW